MFMLMGFLTLNLVLCALLGLHNGEAAIWKISPDIMIQL